MNTRSIISLPLVFILTCVSLAFSAEKSVTPNLPDWVKPEEEPWISQKSSYATATYIILRPKALTTLEELQKLNPDLPKALPNLATLLPNARVSPKFKNFYDEKIRRFKAGSPLSDHDFFDCATMLEFGKEEHKVLLWQSDMDVDTDGSDPLRFKTLEQYGAAFTSHSFMPVLSYGWAKDTSDSNPILVRNDANAKSLRRLQKVLNDAAANAEEQKLLKKINALFETQIDQYGAHRSDLAARAFPLAELDPFIVVPESWKNLKTDPVMPGTLAAVVVKDVIYPCIVADTGDSHKTGEASLKIAKTVNPAASGSNRALTALGATYIVFPHAARVSGRVDYKIVRERVIALMTETFEAPGPEHVHAW